MLRLLSLTIVLSSTIGATAHAAEQVAAPTNCEGRTILHNPSAIPVKNVVRLLGGKGLSYCIGPHQNPDSSLEVDCQGATLDGATASGRLKSAFRITGDVKNVTIRNCKIKNYDQGIEIGLRPHSPTKAQDESDLYKAFRDGTGSSAIAERIRARQPRNITMVEVHISNVDHGVYVYPYSSYVTFSWGSVSNAKNPAIYLDQGTIQNRVTESEFTAGSSTEREAIAIDASAFNKILRNRFYGGWSRGVNLYKNCGENLSPRFQDAQANRIRDNHFQGQAVGVSIADRADKLFSNRKGGESYNNCDSPTTRNVTQCPSTSTKSPDSPYSWFCLGPKLRLPTNDELKAAGIDPATQARMRMSWISPTLVSSGKLNDDWYDRYAYYPDQASRTVVRCNSFLGVGTAVLVADDDALIQGNHIDAGSGLIATPGNGIVIGSRVRSSSNDPVTGVNAFDNFIYYSGLKYTKLIPIIRSGATGTVYTSFAGANAEWGESDACE